MSADSLYDVDDLVDEFLAPEVEQSPEWRDALDRARTRLDRSIRVPCHWGYCIHHVDPDTNTIHSGFGPMACPCDHSKGWRSPYVEGQARPHVPVKVKGRHGSRRQRAIHRQRTMPDYGDTLTYLPGTTRFPRNERIT